MQSALAVGHCQSTHWSSSRGAAEAPRGEGSPGVLRGLAEAPSRFRVEAGTSAGEGLRPGCRGAEPWRSSWADVGCRSTSCSLP